MTYRELKIKESSGYSSVGDPRTKPHIDATTDVHGIADTADIALLNNEQTGELYVYNGQQYLELDTAGVRIASTDQDTFDTAYVEAKADKSVLIMGTAGVNVEGDVLVAGTLSIAPDFETPGAAVATEAYADAAAAAVVDSAPTTLDTLNELAAALGDDPNFATTTAAALGNRVRFDASQTLTSDQQTQARSNISAVSSSDSRLTDARTPSDGSVTTAKIVDGAVTNAKLANSGITINGSSVSLGGSVSITGLPTQTSNSGKFLTTDGSSASWAAIVGGATASDNAPSSPTSGQLWLNSTSGLLYVYYGSAWIDVTGSSIMPDGSVTSAKIADGTIVAGDIADGAITSAKILDGTIVDADINASAAIAQSKINGLPTSLAALAPLASPTFTGTVTVPAATALTRPVMTSPIEVMTVSATAATGTVQFDAITQGVLYYTTNSSANWTLNLRGNSSTTLASLLAVGQSLTVAFMATNSTAYYLTALTLDGSAQTVKWQGGTAPSAGNASSVDVYTFTIVKTASTPTYTVFGQQTKFA